MIKTLIKIFTLVFCISFSSNSFALFGAGDIVSDPTSYTYYVEQIKMMTKEFEEMQKQLETSKGIYDQVDDMRKQLIGTYNHATGTVEDLQRIKKAIKGDPTAMLEYAKKFLNKEIKDGEYIDPRELIEGVFTDPRATKEQTEKFKEANKKYHSRQKTLEDSIVEAEKLLNAMPERYEVLSDLMGRIDSTANVKDAMDLNNRLLGEILKAITDHLSLTAYIGQAQTIINFQGVDDAETEQYQKDLEHNKEKSKKYRPMAEYLKEHDLDDPNMSSQDLFKKIKSNRNWE